VATVLYASEEDVMTAMDVKTTRSGAFIGGRLASASDTVEGQLFRRFYPEQATRLIPWRGQCEVPLDENEVITVNQVLVDGLPLAEGTDYTLIRARTDDPYSKIRLADTVAGEVLEIVGLFGYRISERNVADVVSITGSTLVVSDVSGIGTGALLRIGTERMTVTRRGWITSGNTNPVTLADRNSDDTLTLNATVHQGELILVGSERMLVVDVAGSTVVVDRAVDGTTLAAHTAVTAVYVQRQLTVDRAVLGSTPATPMAGDDVLLFGFPPLVVEYTLAQCLVGIQQARSGYARTVGAGENEQEASGRGLADIRRDAIRAHQRKVRGLVA
jgi:hypothetical protein